MIYVMSGGAAKLFAAIAVTYPAGCRCSCSDGEHTLSAENDSGSWIFPVPKAGTWTVSITDGSQSRSRSVEISAQGQFEKINLDFAFYIFKEGTGLCTAPDGSVFEPVFGALTWSVSEAGIVWSEKKDTGNAFYFQPRLDCSPYSKLCIELQHYEQAAPQYSTAFGVGVNATTGANQANGWTASTEGIWSTQRAVYELPLDNINETLYVKVVSYANTGIIYNIWLEE